MTYGTRVATRLTPSIHVIVSAVICIKLLFYLLPRFHLIFYCLSFFTNDLIRFTFPHSRHFSSASHFALRAVERLLQRTIIVSEKKVGYFSFRVFVTKAHGNNNDSSPDRYFSLLRSKKIPSDSSGKRR